MRYWKCDLIVRNTANLSFTLVFHFNMFQNLKMTNKVDERNNDSRSQRVPNGEKPEAAKTRILNVGELTHLEKSLLK